MFKSWPTCQVAGKLRPDATRPYDCTPPACNLDMADFCRYWSCVTLTGFCEELGQVVIESETCSREKDAMLIDREFRLPSGELLCATEKRWAYFSAIDSGALSSEAGLAVHGIEYGYGGGRSAHRRIFHAGSDRKHNNSGNQRRLLQAG